VRRALLVFAFPLWATPVASAADSLTFAVAPQPVTYGGVATFSGSIAPAVEGEPVQLRMVTPTGSTVLATTPAAPDGTFRFTARVHAPGTFFARAAPAASNEIALRVRPLLSASIYPRTALIGSMVVLSGRLVPAGAGAVKLTVAGTTRMVPVGSAGAFRARLPATRGGYFTARLDVLPAAGWAAIARARRYRIVLPWLRLGSYGASVRYLEALLWNRRYALRGVDRSFRYDTYEAVLAFQKVRGFARTGVVSPSLWGYLIRSRAPYARVNRGDHIEVLKGKQLLYEVRSGRVVRVIHVSTGATGNTPLGRWRIYWKTPGLNSLGMYYSNYFIGGFAIHGYHSVPPWPASHGCVRTPMWTARGIYNRWPRGSIVYVLT
jgi:hypothetical protein